MRHCTLDRLGIALLVTILASVPLARAAAQDRADLIRQAEEYYQNFQTEPALFNLRTALDPTRGQPDSVWVHGVHLLAQIYWEQGDTAQANSWLRWALRADPSLRVDESRFLPEILAAAAQARALVRRTESEGDFVTETRFEWQVGQRVQPTGQMRIEQAGLGTSLRVLVQRSGEPQPRPVGEGITATLTPGSYEINASAEGYLPVRITREVLPGVTTVLRFNLQTLSAAAAGPPPLADGVFAAVRSDMAKLSVYRYGRSPTCATGFYAANAYFVTTYEAIRGADSAVVFPADGSRIENRVVRVAAFDTTRNVAVLKLPSHRDSLPLNHSLTRRGQTVWVASYPDCGTATSRGVRIALGDDPIELAESVAGAQLGGVVVDSTGAVLALAYRGDRAIPAATLSAVLDEARERDRAGQLLTLADVTRLAGLAPVAAQPAGRRAEDDGGGGFPVIIVVGGLVAAGGAAALLLLGKKDDGGGGGSTTTGSIFIRFPNQ